MAEFATSEGISQEAKRNQIFNAIHGAIRFQDFEMLKSIIESDENNFYCDIINENGKFKITPLMRATANSDIEVCKYLISKGASIEMTDAFGANCFHIAVTRGKVETMKLYVEMNPKILYSRVKDASKATALHLSALTTPDTISVLRTFKYLLHASNYKLLTITDKLQRKPVDLTVIGSVRYKYLLLCTLELLPSLHYPNLSCNHNNNNDNNNNNTNNNNNEDDDDDDEMNIIHNSNGMKNDENLSIHKVLDISQSDSSTEGDELELEIDISSKVGESHLALCSNNNYYNIKINNDCNIGDHPGDHSDRDININAKFNYYCCFEHSKRIWKKKMFKMFKVVKKLNTPQELIFLEDDEWLE